MIYTESIESILLNFSYKFMKKIVKTQEKGMITIPAEYRRKLDIQPNALMEARIVDHGVLFTKISSSQTPTRLYSNEEIAQWLEEDKLTPEAAAKVKKLLHG